MEHVLTFDVGGTAIKFGIMNENYEFIDKKMMDTPHTKEDFLQTIIEIIISENKHHGLAAITMSMPGFIDSSSGFIVRGGALSYLDETPLKEILEEAIHIPVFIDNDGRCAVLAEYRHGAGKDCQNLVCITIGTGVGAGIIVHGELIRGAHAKGGEFGMSIIGKTVDGTPLMMHHLASMSALIAQYRRLKNIAQEIKVTGEEILASTDPAVQNILQNWYDHIAFVVYNAAVTFDPDKILLGGGVSAAPNFLENVLASIQKQLTNWSDMKVIVETCAYRNDAGMVGAYVLWTQRQNKIDK